MTLARFVIAMMPIGKNLSKLTKLEDYKFTASLLYRLTNVKKGKALEGCIKRESGRMINSGN